jgi:hypothetical protein
MANPEASMKGERNGAAGVYLIPHHFRNDYSTLRIVWVSRKQHASLLIKQQTRREI